MIVLLLSYISLRSFLQELTTGGSEIHEEADGEETKEVNDFEHGGEAEAPLVLTEGDVGDGGGEIEDPGNRPGGALSSPKYFSGDDAEEETGPGRSQEIELPPQ